MDGAAIGRQHLGPWFWQTTVISHTLTSNTLRKIHFAVEEKKDNKLPFLDVMVTKKGRKRKTTDLSILQVHPHW